MGDLAKRTVVVCVAASSFLGGAYSVGSMLMTQLDSKIVAIATQVQPGSSAAPVDANR